MKLGTILNVLIMISIELCLLTISSTILFFFWNCYIIEIAPTILTKITIMKSLALLVVCNLLFNPNFYSLRK